MRTFTVEEARAFLAAAAAEGTVWEAFYHLALTTGLRPGELCALRWSDLNIETGTISVQQSVQRIKGMGRVVRQPKTAGSRRPIVLDADVIALLRRHRAEQNAERLRMGPLWRDQGLVFCSGVGTALEHKQRHEVFTRICRRAGVPRIRPYDLRHTCASLLLAAGVHPKVVSERLGHSSVNLTLSTYSHVLPTLQQDAAETLGRLLRKGS
jgi:integrase